LYRNGPTSPPRPHPADSHAATPIVHADAYKMQAMSSSPLPGFVGLGLVASSLLAGCAEQTFASSAFQIAYACPAEQVNAHPAGYRSQNYTPITVTGCGYKAEYECTLMSGYLFSTADDAACTERGRVIFESTDGSAHPAWRDKPDKASNLAALASAAHDLPCEPSSIRLLASTVLEGCGQRVVYRVVDYEPAVPPGRVRQALGRRYLMLERTPIRAITPP
jgi:hypothetical protein